MAGSRTETPRAPSVSVVLEWENQLLSGGSRAMEIVDDLGKQISDSGRSTEVIVVAEVEDPALLLEEFTYALDGACELRVLPAGGRHYYEQKNFGAEHASGEIVVFCDSDARPEPGWFDALTGGFERPEVGHADVVSGSTSVEVTSLYSKAMALTWIFPLPDEGLVRPHPQFFANNVAFRRSAFPGFPIDPDQVRGACVSLARQLDGSGHAMWRVPEARTAHPPPAGFVHFTKRALVEGADEVRAKRLAPSEARRWSPRDVVRPTRRRLRKVRRNRRRVDLTTRQLPAAVAIVLAYSGLEQIGMLLETVRPGLAARRFRV